MRTLQLWSRVMTVRALRAAIQANALGSTVEKIGMDEVEHDNSTSNTGNQFV